MARKGFPGIKTVGNRREYPSEVWGYEDWEAEERFQNQLGTNREIGKSAVIPPPNPQIAAGFSLYTRPRAGNARSRGVDALLEQHGFR
ncbi:MAG: hypothetical protein H0U59_06835 [Gemmatimonadaceae bacterium]|nr:hypothetical protein [Gemmatimonadaceae bacterium]